MTPKPEQHDPPGVVDPDTTLSDTFDDPTHNPFAEEDPTPAPAPASTPTSSNNTNDEDERSVASQQLRNDFIRLTSRPSSPQDNDNDNDNENANHPTTTTTTNGYHSLAPSPTSPPTTTTTPLPPTDQYQYYDYSNYNQNGYVTIRNTTQGQSLSKAPTTPVALSTLLPFACIMTHILFLYGQVAVMWKLELTTENIAFQAKSGGTTSALLFNALSLADPYNYNHIDMHHSVKEFTYGYAVKELWEAKGMKSSGVWLAKIAAVGLVVFSGIWPHVKLLLLQYSWTKRTTNPNRRTKTLGWLALLGKWSLADVLTVCVMVGVLNLEWTLQPPTIKEGILENLHTLLDLSSQIWSPADVCNYFLSFDASDCNHVKNKDGSAITNKAQQAKDMLQCRTCKTFVSTAYKNPDTVETTGKQIVQQISLVGKAPDGNGGTNGGSIRLSVIGMKGIYYFCAAVILSVLLSVVVEWYNHLFLESLRQEQEEERNQNGGGCRTTTQHSSSHHSLSLTEEDTNGGGGQQQETSSISASTASASQQQQSQQQPSASAASTSSASAPPEPAATPPTPSSSSLAVSDESDASEPLLSLEDAPPQYEPMEIMDPDERSVFNSVVQRTTSTPAYQGLQCQYIVPLVTLAFVGLAVYLPSMERHVGGGIPDLLSDILDIHFDKTYSLATLRDTTGAAGGWDYLLMATFGLFVVVGPLLRAVLVVLVALTKPVEDLRRIRSLLVRASNFLAAFCAWEVFLVAMIMVELIMPMATETILNTPACHVAAKDGGSCLQVTYERVKTTFACLLLGFVLIGGLAIYINLEDKKERKLLVAARDGEGASNGGGYRQVAGDGRGGTGGGADNIRSNTNDNNASVQSQQQGGGPPLEINTTPSYSMASDNTTVITMMQEEIV